RHVHRRGGGARPALPGGPERRRVPRSRARRHGEDLLQRDGHPRHERGRADSRRGAGFPPRCPPPGPPPPPPTAPPPRGGGGGTTETLRNLVGRRLVQDMDLATGVAGLGTF